MPFFGLFEMGAFSIWLTLLIGIALITYFVDTNKGRDATMTLISVLLLCHLGHAVDLGLMFKHPQAALTFVSLYIGVGIPWACAKWHFFVATWKRSSLKTVAELKDRFLKRSQVTAITEGMQEDWKQFVESQPSVRPLISAPPQVSQNIGRLMTWGVYWPFSLVWTVINDPVRRFYYYMLVEVLGKSLQRVSNKASDEVQKQLGFPK